MLRVQASDLESLARSPRGRRLQSLVKASSPPPPPVPGARLSAASNLALARGAFDSPARAALVTPARGLRELAAQERPLPSWQGSAQELERPWKVNVELDETEIGRLYGQGLARSAIVWRPGMEDWRPLLVTPELQPLLRQTRIEPDARETPRAPASEPGPSEPFWIPNWDDTPAEAFAAAHDADASTSHDASFSLRARRIDTLPAIRLRDLERGGLRIGRRQAEWAVAALLSAALGWWASSSWRADPPAAPAIASPVASREPADSVSSPKLRSALTAAPGTTIPTVLVSELPVLREPAVDVGVNDESPPAAKRSEPPPNSSVVRDREGPSTPGPARRELVNALGRATRSAAACGPFEGRPRVVVTFANTGRVSDVAVRGPGLSPDLRSCVVKTVRSARISPFPGASLTVAKSL